MDSTDPGRDDDRDTGRPRHWWLRVAGAVAAVLAFVALALTVGQGGIRTVGPVVVDQRPWFSLGGGGSGALVGGVLELDGDCLLLSGNAVVWPSGTGWDDAEQVLTVSGQRAQVGDRVFGSGGVRGEDGDAGFASTDAGRATAACRPDDGAVIVFNRDGDVSVS